MRRKDISIITCYDELLANLFTLSHRYIVVRDMCWINNIVTISNNKVSVSLIGKDKYTHVYSDRNNILQLQLYEEGSDDAVVNLQDLKEKGKPILYDNRYALTAHEIIVYSILLSKCILAQKPYAEISLKEIHRDYRGKQCGKTILMDAESRKAYIKALRGLTNKIVRYDLGKTRKNKRITKRKSQHPLLKVVSRVDEKSGDFTIKYSLGDFGRTLIQSKRYSNLMPISCYSVGFKSIHRFLIYYYICRMVYINKNKKGKTFTLSIKAIMNATCRYNISGFNTGDMRSEQTGSGVGRAWGSSIRSVDNILTKLKNSNKIGGFESKYNNKLVRHRAPGYEKKNTYISEQGFKYTYDEAVFFELIEEPAPTEEPDFETYRWIIYL